ncbi:MAG: HIRAN domain-containing protein [Burkholderiaceae bacterium]|nr:HIRAN domain-containing protein [Burkholderiaceae bacterium]
MARFIRLLYRVLFGILAAIFGPNKTAKQKSIHEANSLASQPIHHWPSLGYFEFDVVGESYYQSNLKQIAGDHGKQSAEVTTIATLMPDNDNKFDKNAVRILVAGRTVGYLTREDAPRFRRRLSSCKLGSTALTTCDALVVGGFAKKNGDTASYGLQLDIKPFD